MSVNQHGFPTNITTEDFLEYFREFARLSVKLHNIALPGQQVVYVQVFEGEIVKVGQSSDFITREKSNIYDRKVRGRKLLASWWMPSDKGLEDERELIQMARDLGGVNIGKSREWFTEVSGRALIRKARATLTPGRLLELTFTPAS